MPDRSRAAMIVPATLQALAAHVIERNRAEGCRIALAESCTGGLCATALTEVPGASDVLEASLVSYSDAAKMALLGVEEELLNTFGAVSAATAWAMANGVLDRTRADLVVAITGIAGPTGGTARKPVGTVVFARARRGDDPQTIQASRRQFDPAAGRAAIRLYAAEVALSLLLPGAELDAVA